MTCPTLEHVRALRPAGADRTRQPSPRAGAQGKEAGAGAKGWRSLPAVAEFGLEGKDRWATAEHRRQLRLLGREYSVLATVGLGKRSMYANK